MELPLQEDLLLPPRQLHTARMTLHFAIGGLEQPWFCSHARVLVGALTYHDRVRSLCGVLLDAELLWTGVGTRQVNASFALREGHPLFQPHQASLVSSL